MASLATFMRYLFLIPSWQHPPPRTGRAGGMRCHPYLTTWVVNSKVGSTLTRE